MSIERSYKSATEDKGGNELFWEFNLKDDWAGEIGEWAECT